MPTCYRHPGREAHIRCQRCERAICPDCMVEASVGFQCPQCVAEGRRQTRSARTAFGGRHSANPALTSIVLIGTNLAVWLAILATGWQSSELIIRLALSPAGYCWNLPDAGMVCVDGVSGGAYWQVLTSMFTHVEIWHVGFNMVALYILGPQLEAVMGRARFLALYLLSGLAGSTSVMWLSAEHGATLGASGAVFGLMGALVVVALKLRINAQPLFILVGLNVVITVVGSAFISWQGHFGGLVGGALLGAAVVYAPRRRRTTIQVAVFVAFAVLLAVATVVRILTLT